MYNAHATPLQDIVIEADNKEMDGSMMNMKGVFLHVLGDALGSVVVIASAIAIQHVKGDWKYKIDPAMSLVSATNVSREFNLYITHVVECIIIIISFTPG